LQPPSRLLHPARHHPHDGQERHAGGSTRDGLSAAKGALAMITKRPVRVVGAAIVLTTIAATVLAVVYQSQLVPFVPIHAEGPDWVFVEHPELVTPGFSREFVSIATRYGHRVRQKPDGSIWITRALRGNQEMLWNLTTKAEFSAASTKSGQIGQTVSEPHP